MPGLTRCFACGRPLAAAESPIAAPRVRAANPFARAAPASTRPTQPLRYTGPAVVAAALGGLVPGASALVRRDRAWGWACLAAFGAGWAGVFLAWERPAVLAFAWALVFGAIAASTAREVVARLGARPRAVLVAATLGLAAVIAWNTAFEVVTNLAVAPIAVARAERLSAGRYLTTPVVAPTPDTLVAARADAGRTEWVVAPVLATARQQIELFDGRVYVDGAPTPVTPLVGAVIPPFDPFVVPDDHVVLYAAPLRPLPVGAIRGRIHYRLSPVDARGPVTWPPDPTR